jgi:hypothetical protein
MDATLKRRMWKVAIIHFALSVLVIITAVLFPNNCALVKIDGQLQLVMIGALGCLLWTAINFLQPFYIPMVSYVQQVNWLYLYYRADSKIMNIISIFVLIAFWSLCFGWIFVKLDNWLNHFPVLGRKVF